MQTDPHQHGWTRLRFGTILNQGDQDVTHECAGERGRGLGVEMTLASRWAAGLVMAASTVAGCSSEPNAAEVQDMTNRVLAAAQTGYEQLSPGEQRLLCRDYAGTLPASRDIDAGAVRGQVAMSPDMLRLAAEFRPEAFPGITDQALDEVLADEC